MPELPAQQNEQVVRESNRKFGVEVEFYHNHTFEDEADSLVADLRDHGVDVFFAGYDHSTTLDWKLVTDGSLTDDGLELVSPILGGSNGLREVNKAVGALKQLGCYITSDCGLHVHVDIRNFTLEQMKKLTFFWLDWEPIAFYLVSNSRWTNSYCVHMSRELRRNAEGYSNSRYVTQTYGLRAGVPTAAILRQAASVPGIPASDALRLRMAAEERIRLHHMSRRKDDIHSQISEAGSLDDLRSLVGEERYYSMNLSAFWNQGSVEFRLHHGTLDRRAIRNWIRFCTNLVDYAADVSRPVRPDMKHLAKTRKEKRLTPDEAHDSVSKLTTTLGLAPNVVDWFASRARARGELR